jgi:hypothetical protein
MRDTEDTVFECDAAETLAEESERLSADIERVEMEREALGSSRRDAELAVAVAESTDRESEAVALEDCVAPSELLFEKVLLSLVLDNDVVIVGLSDADSDAVGVCETVTLR